jgi:hypothetical protein
MFLTKLRDTKRSYLVIYHGKCSYICMYINLVSNSVMLQLYFRHYFCNIIFKTTITFNTKLHIASGSALLPLPKCKILGLHLVLVVTLLLLR